MKNGSYIGDPMIAMRELAESYQHAAIYAVASGLAVSLGASLYGLRDFRRVSAVELRWAMLNGF